MDKSMFSRFAPVIQTLPADTDAATKFWCTTEKNTVSTTCHSSTLILLPSS